LASQFHSRELLVKNIPWNTALMIELWSDRDFRYFQKVHLKVEVWKLQRNESFFKKLRKTSREKAQWMFIELSKGGDNWSFHPITALIATGRSSLAEFSIIILLKIQYFLLGLNLVYRFKVWHASVPLKPLKIK
jgi:hypothetical protein